MQIIAIINRVFLYFFILVCIVEYHQTPNGLRYPRWGGRRDAVRLEKC
jgi:hypothetical protein